MRLLLDTDVLLDVGLERPAFVEPAARLLDGLEERPGIAFVAWHSLANFFYLVRPTRGGSTAKSFLVDLCRFVEVSPTTTESLRIAASLEMADFEDALQAAAAVACRASWIVTRNVDDYRRSPIPAIQPAEALDLFAEARPT